MTHLAHEALVTDLPSFGSAWHSSVVAGRFREPSRAGLARSQRGNSSPPGQLSVTAQGTDERASVPLPSSRL